MPVLTLGQYGLIYNVLSFGLASMLASFVFFLLAREHVAKPYRMAIVISALVVFIAGYHYLRIFESFSMAYEASVASSSAVPTDVPFNDAYRYIDWILTVPLLLVELVLVLKLDDDKCCSLLTRLVFAALLMIGLGYPGEVAMDSVTRYSYFVLSCIPFVYILYVLWGELGDSISRQPDSVKPLICTTRYILLFTWLVYPIAYLMKTGGQATAFGEVGVQVGYTIADVLAKCGYGIYIYFIAAEKSRLESDK